MKKISKFFSLFLLLAGVAVLSLVVKAKNTNGKYSPEKGPLSDIIPSASADVPSATAGVGEGGSCGELCDVVDSGEGGGGGGAGGGGK